MTRSLYLARTSTRSTGESCRALTVAAGWQQVQTNDFPTRARAIVETR
jgi:hypothetical protein